MKDYLVLGLLILVALIVLQRGCGNFGKRFRENQERRQQQRQERKEERQQRWDGRFSRSDEVDDGQKRKRFMDGRKRFRNRERNNNTYGDGIGVEETIRL